MQRLYAWIIILIIVAACSREENQKSDWLLNGTDYKAVVEENNGSVTLSNGLVSRTFSLLPDGATTGFMNLMTGNELIRAIKPEAVLTINGIRVQVGGLTGQPVKNYLAPEWIDGLKPDSLSPLKLSGFQTGEISARFVWKKRAEWMAQDMPWPPHGKSVHFTYLPKSKEDNEIRLKVIVHYELYDGLPLICKWVTIANDSENEIIIDSYMSELLALTEEESSVDDIKNWILPNIHVETDYAFGGSMSSESCNEKSVWWLPDPDYQTIVNYNRVQPSMLECRPMIGPAQKVEPGKSFDTFRTWLLVNDSWDRERKGLARRKMYRTIAPWVTENPVFMHLRRSDDESLKRAVEQCVETGFEKIIISFGSGFNIEDTSQANLDRYKKLTVNVYYTGLDRKITIIDREGNAERFKIDRNYNVSIPVTVEPNSESWYIMK